MEEKLLQYQTELTDFLNGVTINNCSHAILLSGYKGYGQVAFVKKLSEKLHLPFRDITENIDADTLLQITTNPNPSIYVIDIDFLSVSQQSAILKTVEMPGAGCFLVLFSSPSLIPSAIETRCRKLPVKKITDKNILRDLFPSAPQELLIEELSPEQIQKYIDVDLSPYNSLLDNMSKNFNRANISNILTIANRFKWNDKSIGELDFDLFLALLLHRTFDNAKSKHQITKLLESVHGLCFSCFFPHVDKRRLFEKFLIEAKENNYQWF